MPSKDGFGFNDDDRLFPMGPGSGQEKTEEPIGAPEFRPPVSSIQDGQLLAKREVFEGQLRTLPEGRRDQREQSQNR